MKYKNVGKAVILEAGETREFDNVMNIFEEEILKYVTVIHGRKEDSLSSEKTVRIIIQIEE